MPAYNEAENIHSAVTSFIDEPGIDVVLVVDNNSEDGTVTIARDAAA